MREAILVARTTKGAHMECSIAALMACFKLSGIYLDADLSYLDADIPRREWHTTVIRHDWGTETDIRSAVNDRPANPYGRLSIGYQMEFKSMTLSIEGWHLSSTTDSDRGLNAVSLRAKWFPFR
jgi:hypothetical protein